MGEIKMLFKEPCLFIALGGRAGRVHNKICPDLVCAVDIETSHKLLAFNFLTKFVVRLHNNL